MITDTGGTGLEVWRGRGPWFCDWGPTFGVMTVLKLRLYSSGEGLLNQATLPWMRESSEGQMVVNTVVNAPFCIIYSISVRKLLMDK